ncbi:hypothetical protein NDK43_19325 [Neobacillus pocheonensis]|jgi:hypothetical protein|uniref:Uncharacterized protein n=1 Tax=Neobacillus pocheonensis TaxID=363869 RepID=A0ABT0WCY4_9BACI|nr:hypothetical protein [Neobacillus pocheonensis]
MEHTNGILIDSGMWAFPILFENLIFNEGTKTVFKLNGVHQRFQRHNQKMVSNNFYNFGMDNIFRSQFTFFDSI